MYDGRRWARYLCRKKELCAYDDGKSFRIDEIVNVCRYIWLKLAGIEITYIEKG
jgi:hypothetical protein